MKVSTRGRYGLKAMIYIGANSKDKCVSLRNIAESEGISENYLEQLISVLKKSNLVKSVRGAYGGYKLAGELNEITIGDILRALEGSLAPVECINVDGSESCNCGANCGTSCITREVWEKIDNSVSEVVDNIYLEELVEKYNIEKNNNR